MLIRLTERALKDWPPGAWREAVWGSPMAQIVKWRKHEVDRAQEVKVLEDYEERFLQSSPAEKEETIRAHQCLMDWMKSSAAKDLERESVNNDDTIGNERKLV